MLEKLLEDGWNYHDSESARLAGELEVAAPGPVAQELVVRFTRLATHTIGEHLGDWPRASRLAGRALDDQTPSPETARAWLDLSVARLLAGDAVGAAEAELAALAAAPDPRPSFVEARFLLATALVGSGRAADALRIYSGALELANRLGEAAPARAVAVASNNAAFDLYELPTRNAREDAVMRAAADAAHVYWKRAGDWTNDERALYLRALVATALGEPARGLELAAEGLAIIAANSPRPIDAALLHLARAGAFAAMGDASGRASEIALADAAAEAAPSPGLKAWYAEERAKVAG